MKVDFAITMSMSWLITTLVAIAAFFSSQLAYAYDLNPLQDICVGVKDTNASGKSYPSIVRKAFLPNFFFFLFYTILYVIL